MSSPWLDLIHNIVALDHIGLNVGLCVQLAHRFSLMPSAMLMHGYRLQTTLKWPQSIWQWQQAAWVWFQRRSHSLAWSVDTLIVDLIVKVQWAPNITHQYRIILCNFEITSYAACVWRSLLQVCGGLMAVCAKYNESTKVPNARP